MIQSQNEKNVADVNGPMYAQYERECAVSDASDVMLATTTTGQYSLRTLNCFTSHGIIKRNNVRLL